MNEMVQFLGLNVEPTFQLVKHGVGRRRGHIPIVPEIDSSSKSTLFRERRSPIPYSTRIT
jgi:hypothetical protein